MTVLMHEADLRCLWLYIVAWQADLLKLRKSLICAVAFQSCSNIRVPLQSHKICHASVTELVLATACCLKKDTITC